MSDNPGDRFSSPMKLEIGGEVVFDPDKQEASNQPSPQLARMRQRLSPETIKRVRSMLRSKQEK